MTGYADRKARLLAELGAGGRAGTRVGLAKETSNLFRDREVRARPAIDLKRFDASWEKIQALDPVRFNERFRRIWRTYLWSCAEMFRSRTSRTHLFQVRVSKGNNDSNYPMSRAFLYRDPH